MSAELGQLSALEKLYSVLVQQPAERVDPGGAQPAPGSEGAGLAEQLAEQADPSREPGQLSALLGLDIPFCQKLQTKATKLRNLRVHFYKRNRLLAYTIQRPWSFVHYMPTTNSV